jgi:hypothetical protein
MAVAVHLLNWNHTSLVVALQDESSARTRFLIENLSQLSKLRAMLTDHSQYAKEIENTVKFVLSLMGKKILEKSFAETIRKEHGFNAFFI